MPPQPEAVEADIFAAFDRYPGNAGKCCLSGVLSALAVISVGGEAAADVTFRMLRVFALQGMFYLGTRARRMSPPAPHMALP